MNPKTIFWLLLRSGKVARTLAAMRNQRVLATRDHLRLCADWLLYSQDVAADEGYTASYSLITGKRHSYIETTGYIIPTMLDVAAALSDERCRASALRAGEWLLSVQQPDGAFTDIDEYKPQVFDTGQVMLGLNRLYRETAEMRWLQAASRAADWLVQAQDPDGSWARMAYHRGQPCTYHSRVAAALLETSGFTKSARQRELAIKHLRWVAAQQRPNGSFKFSELLPGAAPVLHTMVYVLEGFLMAYELTREQEWLECLVRGARPLLRANLSRDLVLRSQYDGDLQVVNPEKCIPGLAQWAGLCLHLGELTGEADWKEAAALSIYYLKSKQLRSSGILRGALPASVPIWGYYHPMMFPNWAVKFFADALVRYEQLKFTVQQEQETWVRKCFELQLDQGNWARSRGQLESVDELVCARIAEAIAAGSTDAPTVLDLGCGAGRYLKELSQRLPKAHFFGTDPGVIAETPEIKRGNASLIPFPDATFDVVYTYITLAHVLDPVNALREVRRVLKPGGKVVVGDRDPWSGRGLLKPYHELRGRWMYPWDSPFRERWYSAGRWRQMLAEAGFSQIRTWRLLNPGDRSWRRLVRMNAFLVLCATSI